jgi:hypothetical protein
MGAEPAALNTGSEDHVEVDLDTALQKHGHRGKAFVKKILVKEYVGVGVTVQLGFSTPTDLVFLITSGDLTPLSILAATHGLANDIALTLYYMFRRFGI